jgi:Xaa-Pro aminopeptidase
VLDATRDSVRAGLAKIAPGNTLGEVARACSQSLLESALAQRGDYLPGDFEAWGHSLGLNWEQPWILPDSDVVIVPGMCLAVEKRIAVPGLGGATYEDNVLVTEEGYELLTPARIDY